MTVICCGRNNGDFKNRLYYYNLANRSRKGVDDDMKRGSIFVLACALLLTVVPYARAAYNPDAILAQDIGSIYVSDYGSDTQLTDQYGTYYVENCFDHNLNTCWAEGVSGDGIGSGIWGRWRVSRGDWRLAGVAIWGGYQKSDDVFYKNGRPCNITVDVYCDGATKTINAKLYDHPQCNLLFFEDYAPFYDEAEVFITLDSVYLGTKYHDTCITDIDLIVLPY